MRRALPRPIPGGTIRLGDMQPARSILALAALACSVSAAQDTPYVAVPGFESVDYTSLQVPSHALQRFALFYPEMPAPAAGYPVVVQASNPGYASTDKCFGEPLEGNPLYQFLDAGYAVIRAAMTYSDMEAGPGPCFPIPSVGGNGLFHPPGAQLPGLAVEPYLDPDRPFAEKDVVMLVQHVRHHAAAMGLDPERIALYTRSGGTTVAMWAALGPERGPGLFPGGGVGQDLESSRVDAAILRGGLVYTPALAQLGHPGVHFPRKATGAPWDESGPLLNDTFDGFQREHSAVFYEDHGLNAAQRFYMTYEEPFESTDFLPATPGALDYLEDALSGNHSAWHGYVWKTLHPQTRLVLVNQHSVLPVGPLHDELIDDEGLLVHDMLAYLDEELGVERWLSYAGPGVPRLNHLDEPSTPVLTGRGPFDSVDRGRVGLSMGRPLSPFLLVHGSTKIDLPLLGGTLGPSIDILYSGLVTDSDGAFELLLPPGYVPAGATVYLQAWILDPDTPEGFAASNTAALVGI